MNLPADYTLVAGVCPDNVPEHIRNHWYYGRMGLERNRALQGAFTAHVKAWEAVQRAGDDGAIVLEDDCLYYRQHPHSVAQYPRDAITLLGGCFRGFGKWGLCETSFISAGKFLDAVTHLPVGVQELPKQLDKNQKAHEMRWAMCVAYYMPPGMAKELLAVVFENKKKTFKSPDIFLQPFTKYFLWPPAFGDQGDQSCCFTDKRDLGTDLYCSAEMRMVAQKLHRPLPPAGCSTIALLDWQIRAAKKLFEGLCAPPQKLCAPPQKALRCKMGVQRAR